MVQGSLGSLGHSAACGTGQANRLPWGGGPMWFVWQKMMGSSNINALYYLTRTQTQTQIQLVLVLRACACASACCKIRCTRGDA